MRTLTFYLIAAVVAVADQISKWSVDRSIPSYGRPVIPGLFSLTPTHNPGGAFSLFQAHPSVFVIVAVCAIVMLIGAYTLRRHNDRLLCMALALALGGAVGNLLDRARFGYVRDFFHLHNPEGRTLWPIFNIADSAITVSVVLFLYRSVFVSRAGEQRHPDASFAADEPR